MVNFGWQDRSYTALPIPVSRILQRCSIIQLFRSPRINALVDVCNWCSLELQLPYGLYDRARISPPVELRLGHAGESYAGIRKDEVHVEGRLTLADAIGAFGNPTSDSARTMVTPATTEALAVIFAPRELGPAVVESALDATARRAAAYTGATEVGRFVV
jgi:DNA/RNA-binding domain of Phe-tRNA-synthetase-like protein